MNAVNACMITGSGYNAARPAADNDGFVREFRIIAFLDRRKKSIAINMRNRQAFKLRVGKGAPSAAIWAKGGRVSRPAVSAITRVNHGVRLPEFGRSQLAGLCDKNVVSFTKLYTVRVMFCKRNPNAVCTEC